MDSKAQCVTFMLLLLMLFSGGAVGGKEVTGIYGKPVQDGTTVNGIYYGNGYDENIGNLFIGGIGQRSQNPDANDQSYKSFSDDNSAIYVPTYYMGVDGQSEIFNFIQDGLQVDYAAQGIRTPANGLSSPALNDKQYDTVIGYSGGTTAVVTAMALQNVSANTLILISPMRGGLDNVGQAYLEAMGLGETVVDEFDWDFDWQREFEQKILMILNAGTKIIVIQSEQDKLPLGSDFQYRFSEDLDARISVHDVSLINEGEDAHREIFFDHAMSYIKNGVYAVDVSSMGPEKEWNKTFGRGSQEDKAYSVQPTSDGGYVLAGYMGGDAWLIKTDSNGNELWERNFGSGVIKSVQPTNDGGFVLVGFTRHRDAWIIRTDGDGRQIWDRTIGRSNLEEANAVQQTSDDGYVMAGSIEHWLSPGYFYLSLIKMDSNGNELWQKTFGGEAEYEKANSVLQTSNGGYVLAGVTESFGSGGKDAWLIKTDSYGDAIWHTTFGGSDDDWSNSVQQTSDGGYILAGVTSDDAWLIKTDSDGNELWQRTFGEHPRVNWAHSVQQTADGGYVLAGVSGYYEWWEGECIGDAWLIKTDSDGNKLWQRTFGDPGAESRVYSVQQASDGSYILAGMTDDDAWLIKVASG